MAGDGGKCPYNGNGDLTLPVAYFYSCIYIDPAADAGTQMDFTAHPVYVHLSGASDSELSSCQVAGNDGHVMGINRAWGSGRLVHLYYENVLPGNIIGIDRCSQD